MSVKPSYEELEQRIKELEQEVVNREYTQKRLNQQEKTLQALLNASMETAILVDLEGTILAINEIAAQRIGKDIDELIGLGIFDYLPHDMAQSRMTKGEEVIHSGKPVRFQDDRGGRFYDNNIYPVFDTEGKVKSLAIYAKDITEAKQAEEALKQSEERYKSLIHKIQAAVVVHDADTRIISCNSKAQSLLGLTEDQILEKTAVDPYWEFYNTDGKRMSPKEYPVNQVLASRQPLRDFTAGINIPNKTDQVWVLVNADPVMDKEGNIQQVIVTFMDITDHKHAEEALRNSEERYRSLFENTGTATFVTNDDMTISQVNAGCEKLSGYSREEIVGKMKTTDFVSPEDLERIIKYHTGRREEIDESPPGYEFNLVDKHGKVKTVFIQVAMIPGTKQSIASIVDITSLKETEKALQESEEKYRILFENATDAIFMAQDGLIKFPNPKALEMIGYTEEELEKIPFADLLHPEDREVILERYKKRLAGDNDIPSTYSHRVRNKKGDELWVELNAIQITWDGRPAGLNFIRDITQQKRIESQLQQAQKLEAIATLAGGIAHQFNNALSPITVNLEMLEMDSSDDEDLINYVKPMRDSIQRMAQLTNQLLAYARGGKYRVKIISPSDLVRDTLPLIEHIIDPAIHIDTDLPRNILPIEADITQIQMVLTAVLQNASEAIKGEGLIKISSRNQEIDEASANSFPEIRTGSYVSLTIEDDGKGMDEQTKSRIFEPFFTTKFQGRGLGMAAVYGIIKNHGGWITVDSELDRGTTVRILLPMVKEKVKETKKPSIKPIKGIGTILVVEDEEAVLNTHRRVLEKLGYRILEARTGKEAIEIAYSFAGKIDLAILDVVLPDMDGKTICPFLMKARPNTKVLVCSGYTLEGLAQEILDVGAHGFIQKPFSVVTLSNEIKKLIEGK